MLASEDLSKVFVNLLRRFPDAQFLDSIFEM